LTTLKDIQLTMNVAQSCDSWACCYYFVDVVRTA